MGKYSSTLTDRLWARARASRARASSDIYSSMGLLIFTVFLYMDRKRYENAEKYDFDCKLNAKHPFAGQNTQQAWKKSK